MPPFSYHMGHGTFYDYDNRGNLLSALNDTGKGTTYEYNDQANRDFPTDVYDALNQKTHIEYDQHGNIEHSTNLRRITMASR